MDFGQVFHKASVAGFYGGQCIVDYSVAITEMIPAAGNPIREEGM
jgi:hypothetical protein